MIKLFFLFFLVLSSFLSYAQYSIKGRVHTTTDDPLNNAKINLFNNEEKISINFFTDTNGIFYIEDIKKNNYYLQIKYLDSKVYLRELLVDSDIDLNKIIVNTETSLNELIIKSNTKLVEKKDNRIIYNISNSISSQGTNALEVLNTTPLVKINNNSLEIIGKGTATILINNRYLHLSEEVLIGYLSTLSSDSIEKIEIISAPSSKYAAEGNGGVINIVTKKNFLYGLHGTLSTTFNYNNNNTWNGHGTISYQNKNWNILAKLSNTKSDYWNSNSYIYTTEKNSIVSKNIINGTDKTQNASITTNYTTNNFILGVAYDYTRLRGNYFKENTTTYFKDIALTNQIQAIAENNSKNAYHLLNAFLENRLDTLGIKFFLGANFFTNNPNSQSDINDKNDFTMIKNNLNHINDLKYTVYGTNFDFAKTLNWATIEIGAKYTHYDSKLTMDFYNFNGNDINENLNNIFNYYEQNTAAYIDFEKDINKVWKIKAGIRYEETKTDSHLLNTDESYDDRYGMWFPSVYLNLQPNDKHSLSINYAKRIERPHAKALNPFRYYDNSYSYNGGNPRLLPTYSETIEFSYLFDDSLNISLSYQKTTDTFDQLTIFDDNTLKTSYYNMLDTKSINLTFVYNLKPTSWWETNLSIRTFTNQSSYTTNTNQIPQNGINLYYLFYNTLNISKVPNINVFINWLHQLPSKEDNTRYHGFKNLSSGLNLKLLDSDLIINTSFTDILNTVTSSGTIYFTNNTQYYQNKWNARTISLSATYYFGNSKNRKAIKEVYFDDSDRSKI